MPVRVFPPHIIPFGTCLHRRPHSVDSLDNVVATRADARDKRRHVLTCAAAHTQNDCDIAGCSRRCSEQAMDERGRAGAGDSEALYEMHLLEPRNDTAQHALCTVGSHTSRVTIRHGRPRALMRPHAHIRPHARLYRTRRTNAYTPVHMRAYTRGYNSASSHTRAHDPYPHDIAPDGISVVRASHVAIRGEMMHSLCPCAHTHTRSPT